MAVKNHEAIKTSRCLWEKSVYFKGNGMSRGILVLIKTCGVIILERNTNLDEKNHFVFNKLVMVQIQWINCSKLFPSMDY